MFTLLPSLTPSAPREDNKKRKKISLWYVVQRQFGDSLAWPTQTSDSFFQSALKVELQFCLCVFLSHISQFAIQVRCVNQSFLGKSLDSLVEVGWDFFQRGIFPCRLHLAALWWDLWLHTFLHCLCITAPQMLFSEVNNFIEIYWWG
jgi:hypothetical protein